MADIKSHSTLATNLVSYWDLEEASGGRYDLVGSNDLTENGTGGVGQAAGKTYGNGGDFVVADTDYLNIASDTSLYSSGSWSVSYWVKYDSLAGNPCVIGYSDNGDTATFLHAYIVSDKLVFRRQKIGTWTDLTATTSYSTGTWYHVVLSFSTTNGMRIYRDGSLDGTLATTNGKTANSNSATREFDLGRRYRTGGDLYFDGVLDEVGWWHKELTSTEVTDLYNSGSGLPYYDPADVKNDTDLSTNLVSYWEQEQSAGATSVDSVTATGNDLTDNGTVGTATGILGEGADYDGSADYHSITDASQTGLDIASYAGFSVAGWINFSTYSGSATYDIASKYTNLSRSFVCTITSERMGFIVAKNSVQNNDADTRNVDLPITPSTSTWYHVAYVFDETNQNLRCYWDGVYIGGDESSEVTSMVDSTEDFEIGTTSSLGGRYFPGVIDEIGFYSKALSVGEVRALYGYGTPPVYDAGGAPAATDNALAWCNF